jgi:hypothetical protein
MEARMEQASARRNEHARGEYRCIVCGQWLNWEDLCCETHADGGLGPVQYVELFWDEA